MISQYLDLAMLTMVNIVLDILVPISGAKWTKTCKIRQASMILTEQFGALKF